MRCCKSPFSLAGSPHSPGQFRLFTSRLRGEPNRFHYFLLCQIPLFVCPSVMRINLQYFVKRTNCFKVFFLMHEYHPLLSHASVNSGSISVACANEFKASWYLHILKRIIPLLYHEFALLASSLIALFTRSSALSHLPCSASSTALLLRSRASGIVSCRSWEE